MRPEVHRERIKNDYEAMRSIQNTPYVSWKVVRGEPPYVEEYELTIHVKTYSAPNKIMDTCRVRISLGPEYPGVVPHAKMVSTPLVFHPHWFVGGDYCPGHYVGSETLVQFIKRMIMTLQNDPSLVDPTSPANSKALEWFLKNKNNRRLFPSDTTKLTENKGFRVTKRF